VDSIITKNKDKEFIGVRFTSDEKEIIDKLVKKQSVSYNEFIRKAVLSHINNIEKQKEKININRIQSNINNINQILPALVRNIQDLYKETEGFQINKKTYFIT
jgi:uncharacterized protein (DUF1778 family)